jgi:trigger factor
LKIESQHLEDHQVKLVVEVEPEPFEKARRQAASRLSRRTKIPGFRPGKAPYHIVERHIGEEAILDESLEILLKDLYPKIIDEADIQPHGPGKLENIVSVKPLQLEFIVPLAAEVELSDYRSMRLPYELEAVTEEDVEKVLQDLRQRQAIEEPADRPAEAGDHVFIRLSAERAIVEEGEEASLIAENPHSLVIASEDEEDEDEWPYPGFSRELIGMSAGDEKTLTHHFPEDSDFESLRGATAQFKIVMEEVKARTLPDLDDEFAQSLGEYENLEGLRTDIRESLERQAQESYDEDYQDKILTEILEQSSLKYPPQMLEEEVEEVIHQLQHRLQAQNLDLETYLRTREMSEEDLRKEVEPVAETRLKRSMVLVEISKEEGIEIPRDEVEAQAQQTLNALFSRMSEKDLKNISNEQLIPNLVGNIMADMKIGRTLARLKAIAKGEIQEAEEENSHEAVAENVPPAAETEQVEETAGEAASMQEEVPSAESPQAPDEETQSALEPESSEEQ